MVDTEGSEIHTGELKEPIKTAVWSLLSVPVDNRMLKSLDSTTACANTAVLSLTCD